MPDYSLVPVDHQPDFDDHSLVPVDHDPFIADGLAQQAQFQLVPRHSDYDWLIPSQFRMGRSVGATRIWILRATPG
jgi:hypothetical protein